MIAYGWIHLVGSAILCWFLVALGVLDAEYFWLPDRLTYPGFAIGFVLFLVEALLGGDTRAELLQDLGRRLLAIAAAAGMILFIRLAYWLVRRKEGMGLGDAKLMAMLAAWLGLSGTLESFVLAILIATFAALLWLAVLIVRRNTEGWATMPLPFGTFLCAAALFPIFHSTWNLRGVLLNIQN